MLFLSDFFMFWKWTELCCFITYLSDDPHNFLKFPVVKILGLKAKSKTNDSNMVIIYLLLLLCFSQVYLIYIIVNVNANSEFFEWLSTRSLNRYAWISIKLLNGMLWLEQKGVNLMWNCCCCIKVTVWVSADVSPSGFITIVHQRYRIAHFHLIVYHLRCSSCTYVVVHSLCI